MAARAKQNIMYHAKFINICHHSCIHFQLSMFIVLLTCYHNVSHLPCRHCFSHSLCSHTDLVIHLCFSSLLFAHCLIVVTYIFCIFFIHFFSSFLFLFFLFFYPFISGVIASSGTPCLYMTPRNAIIFIVIFCFAFLNKLYIYILGVLGY